MTTLEKVKQLDDFKALRLFRHIETEMMQKVEVDVETLIQQLPEQIQKMPQIQKLDEVDEADFNKTIENEEAVKIAREVLEWMAVNPSTEAYLDDKLDNWQDQEMVAGTILAVGGALSMVMLLPTLQFSYTKEEGWKLGGGIQNDLHVQTIKHLLDSIFKVIRPNLT